MSQVETINPDSNDDKPVVEESTRMVMAYRDPEGKKQAILLHMGNQDDIKRLVKTTRWASHAGVIITLSPV